MHHKLVKNPFSYTFSSYQTLSNSQPTLLNREQVLEWFDGRDNFIDFHNYKFEAYQSDFLDLD